MRNDDVLKRVKEDCLPCWTHTERIKRKQHSTDFGRHNLREESKGRPRRMLMDDNCEWSAKQTYAEVKRLVADRETWRKVIMTHLTF